MTDYGLNCFNVLRYKKSIKFLDPDFYQFNYFLYFFVAFYGIHLDRLTELPTFLNDMFLPKLFGYLEQPRTASLCRGWAMLENDFNLICR